MLKGKSYSLFAALYGTFLACLPVGAAQSQDGVVMGGGESGLPKVGEPFRDCPECPLMVRVPSGSFQMADPERSPAGSVREWTLSEPLAVGVYEVTFDEWDACRQAGACLGHPLSDGDWGRGDRPAIHLHWENAQSYVVWLRESTGKGYRLLTEAEWEYAARAGTSTKYGWGDEIGANRANCAGCGSPWDGDRTAPVGSFAPNAWGLHDMHGNVWELVTDCWQVGHVGVPLDGGARLNGECSKRVMRGGGWRSVPNQLASSMRSYYADPEDLPIGKGHVDVGLRVARALAWQAPELGGSRTREEIEAALSPLKLQDQVDAERSIELHIPFIHGTPDLAPAATQQIKVLAAAIFGERLAAYDFGIEAQYDSLGDVDYNRKLAQLRAQAFDCRLPFRRLFHRDGGQAVLMRDDETEVRLMGLPMCRGACPDSTPRDAVRYLGDLISSRAEGRTAPSGQPTPKFAHRQKIRIFAMPNRPQGDDDASAGSAQGDQRYSGWRNNPSLCWTFMSEGTRHASTCDLDHEVNREVIQVALEFRDDKTFRNLGEDERKIILKVVSDAGMHPNYWQPDDWPLWIFEWPYVVGSKDDAWAFCDLFPGRIRELLDSAPDFCQFTEIPRVHIPSAW